jgi:hypothetical protein
MNIENCSKHTQAWNQDGLCLRLQVKPTQLGPIDRTSPYRDRIQFPKRYVLKQKQDDILNKDKTIDNVQKRNICTNFVFYSLTLIS